MNHDDIVVWPNDFIEPSWCYLDELEYYGHDLSDDYYIIPFGTDEYYEFLDSQHGIE